MAQVSFETGNGARLHEQHDGTGDAYFEKMYNGSGNTVGNKYPGDGAKFSGTGYIHLTGRYNYQKFADYINDQKIMQEGWSYVESNYAWEAAGYFWSVLTRANSVASNPNVHPDDLSKIVNFHDKNTFAKRANIYYNICEAIK